MMTTFQMMPYHLSTRYFPTKVQPQRNFYSTGTPKTYAEPSRPIQQPIMPHQNDVLMGRGGNNNKWHGNESLRDMARAQVHHYLKADKKQKSSISVSLVSQVHALSPAGRFLKRDPNTMLWQIVPDEQAREKASQCLRDAVTSIKKRDSISSKGSQEPTQVTPVSPTQKAKRGMAPCEIDMNDLVAHKRRRVSEAADDDGTINTSFTISASVIEDLLQNTPANDLFDEFNVIPDHDSVPEFELFDPNTLLDEQTLLLEPIADISFD